MSRYAYSLKPFGSSQKDFYGKAIAIVIVIVTRDKYESTERLISYETQVVCHDYNNSRVEISSKHIKSFLNMVYGEGNCDLWDIIHYAIKVWGCKSFKAFCELNPTISTDSQYIIKASGKPTVSLTNIQ